MALNNCDNDFTLDEIKEMLDYALSNFYKNDFSLLDYKTEDEAVSERCIVFHIGYYFYDFMKTHPKWHGFNIDTEYNRCFNHPKSMYETTSKGIREKIGNAYPDMIIHKRRSNTNNVIIIEFKKNGTYKKKSKDDDSFKLKYFTDPNNEYKFRYGFWIVLYKKKADVYVFEKGKEKSDLKYIWSYNE